MPRSELSLLREELRRELGTGAASREQVVDMGVRLRLYECSCGRPHAPVNAKDSKQAQAYLRQLQELEHFAVPKKLLPRVYGGRYDRRLRKYVGRPQEIAELECHEGQLPLLAFDDYTVRRLLAVGSPGAGKTFAALIYAILEALKWPNTTGGIVAPVGDRRQLIWDDLQGLLEPLGWIDDVSEKKHQVVLANGVKIDVLAAKAGSKQTGNPLQGRSWDWAVVDESQNVDDRAHREIAARGRRNAKRYRIIETATNDQFGPFQIRLKKFSTTPRWRRVQMTGFQNPWVDPEWWIDFLRGEMTEREYAQFILGEDVPPELLLYYGFDLGRNLGPIPAGARDVTADVVFEHFRRPGVKWIGAQDFGVLVTCTVMIQCWEVQEQRPGGFGTRARRIWVARNEITSGHGVTADVHAKRILDKGYKADELIVIADPHFNTKDTDKSDFRLFERAGLHIVPANHGPIKREHRYAMVNMLCRDGHVLVETDSAGNPRCTDLATSFISMQRNELGEGERDRKDKNDKSHWTAALGYGVFPFEKIRGAGVIRTL